MSNDSHNSRPNPSNIHANVDASVEWRVDPSNPKSIKPYLILGNGTQREIDWCPQPGSQELFLNCPLVEVLYEGTRGPGKTDALLMDFYQDVGKGYGEEWRGVLFRKTYPELQDVIEKSKKWFKKLCPAAEFNQSKTQWKFPEGEILYFRQFEKSDDYWKYHGHAYPWIAWEELCNWADDKCYRSMFSCSRSTYPGIPIKIRATTNPYGVGHNWVKARWRLPGPPGSVANDIVMDDVDEDGNVEPPRVSIHGRIQENIIMMTADPSYIQRIAAAARNPAEKKAWLEGSWDIVAGGMFDDIWFEVSKICVIEPFDVPENWRIDRSFDWGSSRPFSVGWWAVSNGEDVKLRNGKTMNTVKGDLFRIAEWYGWNGRPNEGMNMLATEVSKGIIERELRWGWHGRVKAGPADSSIFDEDNGNCIANDMGRKVRIDGVEYHGVTWQRADKSSGSRKQGWEQIRKMLKATKSPENGVRENAGMFIFNTCNHFLRTIPSLPRDDKDIDDVDTEAEDHIGDEVRYRARFERKEIKSGSLVGFY